MEEKKKNNMGLIVFLVILVLGLAGYICYDKFLKPKESIKCTAKSTDSENKNLKDKNCEESKTNKYDIFANNMKAKRKDFNRNNTFYKWRGLTEGNYYVYLDSNGDLYITYTDEQYAKKYNNYKIASNVLSYYISEVGVGEGSYLYFINENGTVGEADTEVGLSKTSSISIKNDIGYKNIVAIQDGIFGNEQSGAHYPIFIDIDGNMFSDGFKEMNK